MTTLTPPSLSDDVSEMQASMRRLSRDLAKAAETLSDEQARYLVDLYYQLQNIRIRAGAQSRTLNEAGEPNTLLTWYFDNYETFENDVRRSLKRYAQHHVTGQWALSIVGIGPVIAAGLLAHIDITRAPTVGHIWRFAGLDPSVKWEAKTKRPWNAKLKRLCWIIGESFVKVQNNANDVYGHIYAERKALEQTRNERGDFLDQAIASLAAKNYGKDTQARAHYEDGKLPPARIHLRAERYATKLFLAHYHHVAFEHHYGEKPPKPYILTREDHVHYIAPPNWPLAA